MHFSSLLPLRVHGLLRHNLCIPLLGSQQPMVKKTKPLVDESDVESEEVFEKAAEVFRVMSAPMRLRIISALCNGEKNVGELLAEINTTQPNMSQHLSTLYQAGVLGKRREGVQIYYRIINDKVVSLCRAVCVQIASESPASV